MIYEVKSLPL